MLIHSAVITGSVQLNNTDVSSIINVAGFATTSSVNALSSSIVSVVKSKMDTDGVVSGSSQLTSSYDNRYVLSGSITQTTWDNIANKPAGIVSSSTQIIELGFATTSSVNDLQSKTGSYATTSSVNNLQSVTGSYATTSSFDAYTGSNDTTNTTQNTRLSTIESVTGSYATTSSVNNLQSVTGSYATTGSNQFNGNQSISGSITSNGTITAQTINVQTITSSIEFVTGSTRNGSLSSNTHEFTGSVLMSGSVGIGTSSPSGILDVIGTDIFLGATSKIVLSYNYGTSANSNSPELAFYGQSFAATTSVYGPSIQAVNQTTFARKDLVFYQHNAADFTNRYEAMRLTYGGNVGIGTSSPTDSIIGAGTFLDIASTGGGALKLHYTNATAAGELSFYKGSNGSYIDSAGAATLANNDLIFRTGGTVSNYGVSERVRITSAGQITLSNSPGIRFVSGSSNLNYYTTSTWTPQFAAGGTTSFGLSSQTGTGRYTRIGNVVTIHGQITWNGAGSSGTNLNVNNLPFRVAGDVRSGIGVGLVSGIGDIYAGGLQLVPELNSFVMYLITHPNDGSAHIHLTGGAVKNNGSKIFSFSGSYITDE